MPARSLRAGFISASMPLMFFPASVKSATPLQFQPVLICNGLVRNEILSSRCYGRSTATLRPTAGYVPRIG